MAHHGSDHGHGTHGGAIDPHDLGHIVPSSVFLTVFIALLVLTAITVGISRIDFGAWNFVIAMLVASVKALLVMCFFMHLKYENPIVILYVVFPITLIFVMLAGLFIDNPYRHTTYKDSGTIYAPDGKPFADATGHDAAPAAAPHH